MRLAKMRVAGLYGYMATSPPTPPSSCRDVLLFAFFGTSGHPTWH